MPSLYTPFLGKAGAAIGRGIENRGIQQQKAYQGKLATSAYMGDPQATQELMQVNPQLGMEIAEKARQRADTAKQAELNKQTRKRKLFTDNQEIIDQIIDEVASLDSFEKGKAHFDQKKQEYRPIFGDALDDTELTEQVWQRAREMRAAKNKDTDAYSAKSEFLEGGGTRTINPESGAEEVRNTMGDLVEGDDAVAVLERAAKIKAGRLDADADRTVDTERRKQQVKNAEESSKAAFEMVDKLRQNITNLEAVVPLVGAGADTGPIADYFPSFKAETVKLYQLQKRLALDVVGATTFGALSKGELDLAKAVALPTGLEGDDLIRWVNDSIAAKRKLAQYFEDQAIFLSAGGTQDGWLKKGRAELKSLFAAAGKFQPDKKPITEADIAQTMRDNKMTRPEVLDALREQVKNGP